MNIYFPMHSNALIIRTYCVYMHRMKKIRKGFPDKQLDRVVNLDF